MYIQQDNTIEYKINTEVFYDVECLYRHLNWFLKDADIEYIVKRLVIREIAEDWGYIIIDPIGFEIQEIIE